jgi:integrase
MGGFSEDSTGSAKRRKWLGGYVREGKRGVMFVIERWLGNNHFHLSTRCRTERAALAELAKFEADPTGYRPGAKGELARKLCIITPELIDEYERWQRDTRGTTTSHARDCARYLEQWMHAFAGRDIRRLDLHADIKAALDRWTIAAKGDRENPRRKLSTTGARKSRIVALKGFTAWLRREKGFLKRGEDPTLDLQVPHAEPEKLRRRKAVPFAHVQKLLGVIREDCRDTLMVLANTGLHVSEVRRFAASGELFEPSAEKQKQGARAMLAVKHKTGRLHVVALTTDEALDAAKRIRASGWAPSHSVVWFAMRAACEAAKVPAFNAGVLRHSVATWLHEAGVPLDVISEQLGHRDRRTTADFYRDMGGQAKVLALALPHLKVVR